MIVEPAGFSCNYFTSDSFNDSLELETNDKFSIFHHNIRSFAKIFDELSAFLGGLESKFHVFVFTETWFAIDTVIDIEGYTGYHTCRPDRSGGGVSIYVDNHFTSSPLPVLTLICDSYEVCAAKLHCGKETIYIIGTYRAPGDAGFDNHLFNYVSLLNNFNVQNKKVYIVGDFNVNTLVDSGRSRMFTDSMYTMCLLPAVNIPTRVTANSETLIDNIWTNQLSIIASGVFVLDVSDHFPIFIVSCLSALRKSIVKYFRDHSERSLNTLESSVSLFVSDYFVDDNNVNVGLSQFMTEVTTIYNRCCPIRSKNYSTKTITKPWIDLNLRNMIRRKHYLFRQLKSGGCSYSFYSRFKNTVVSSMRSAKRRYFRQKFRDSAGSTTDTWRLVRRILNSNRKYNEIVLDVEGSQISDNNRVAEAFNSYFSSVAENIDRSIPLSDVFPLSYLGLLEFNQSFFAVPSDSLEVMRIVNSLKLKGVPLSELPAFIFKKLRMYICPIISEYFNLSVKSGIFPEVLKIARVTPIYKAGDKSSVCNYRPISSLPTVSKIFETLMCNRMKNYIEKFQILSNCQFGFRPQFSTVDAVAEFIDNVNDSLDRRQSCLSVFMDLQKAFDTVDHEILCNKMRVMGFRGPINDWFISYLRGRSQCVSIGGVLSDVVQVCRGVPQGSVLGPLLFNLYINDMSRATDLNIIHYADDTTVYCSGPDLSVLVESMNSELSKLDKWLCTNKLSLSGHKSKVMLFTKRPIIIESPIKFRDEALEVVDSIKFLGVILDNKLSFRLHCSGVITKLCRSLGIMRKLSSFVPGTTLRMLYFSLFYCHLTYAVVIWGNSSLTVSNRINSLQRQVVRLLCPNQSTEAGFESLKLLKFSYIVRFFTVIKLVKVFIGKSVHFSDRISSVQVLHGHNTRGVTSGILTNVYCRTASSHRSFLPKAIEYWNDLPVSLRSSSADSAFKCSLRRHFQECSNLDQHT